VNIIIRDRLIQKGNTKSKRKQIETIRTNLYRTEANRARKIKSNHGRSFRRWLLALLGTGATGVAVTGQDQEDDPSVGAGGGAQWQEVGGSKGIVG
jgi:hypothetical protein